MTKAKTVKKNYDNGTEVSKLVELVIIVTIIFVIFYGITVLVNKKEENSSNNNSQTVSVQYDEILISNILIQPNDEYYVMIYDIDDYDGIVYNSYLQLYKQKEEALRYYTAQLDNIFNKIFKSEESNLNISNIKQLKIKGSTLLKIRKGKIIAYYEGDKIIEHLKEITTDEEAE